MHGGRHLHGPQEAGGNDEPVPPGGLLAWWQRRSWRMDLAVLARVRDGLKRLDEEPGVNDPLSAPTADTPDIPDTAAAETLPTADPRAPAALTAPAAPAGHTAPAAPAGRTAPAGGGGVLPDAAIASIRETFAIVAAAGEAPASYFYGRLFVGNPHLRNRSEEHTSELQSP